MLLVALRPLFLLLLYNLRGHPSSDISSTEATTDENSSTVISSTESITDSSNEANFNGSTAPFIENTSRLTLRNTTFTTEGRNTDGPRFEDQSTAYDNGSDGGADEVEGGKTTTVGGVVGGVVAALILLVIICCVAIVVLIQKQCRSQKSEQEAAESDGCHNAVYESGNCIVCQGCTGLNCWYLMGCNQKEGSCYCVPTCVPT